MTLLAVDIGNTEAVFGYFKDRSLVSSFRLKTKLPRTADELAILLAQWMREDGLDAAAEAVYCSVVPNWSDLLEDYFAGLSIPFMAVSHNMRLPFEFDYDAPETLGPDRIVNAAACAFFYDDNCLLVDFGTAITFCALVNKKYVGGVIVPGMNTAFDSLARNTAKLPQVGLRKHPTVLGKDTRSSLEAGAYYGYRGMVKEILEELESEIDWPDKPKRIATGGVVDSLGFNEYLFDILDRELTLKGLAKLYELNKN